jgi:hypothetical protein
MHTLVAQQPNFAPYMGFFHRVAQADVLVVQDDLQYSKQEWQNRNRVRSGPAWRWLTVPVHGSHRLTIREVFPVDDRWPARHARILRYEYRASPWLGRVEEFERLVRRASGRRESLAEVNTRIITWALDILGLTPTVVLESDLRLPPRMEPNERLLLLCRRLGCDRYLSGPGGAGYLDPRRWAGEPVRLDHHRFAWEPHPQPQGGWVPDLSVLDFLFSVDAPDRELRRRLGAAVPAPVTR